MNTDSPHNIIEQAKALLAEMPSDIRQRVYLERDEVAILLDPYQVEGATDKVQLPLTILPLVGRGHDLSGVAAYLRPQTSSASTPIRFGSLKRRGQLTFANVAIIENGGGYSMALQTAAELAPAQQNWRQAIAADMHSSLQGALIRLPVLEKPEPDQPLYFQSAAQTITAVITATAVGKCVLELTSTDKTLEGQFVGISWLPAAESEAQLLLALFAQDGEAERYTATLELGDWSAAPQICLLDQPWSADIVHVSLLETIAQSIMKTVSAPSRAAWQGVVAAANLPERSLEGLIGNVWSDEAEEAAPAWQQVAAVQRLMSQVKILIGQTRAFFDAATTTSAISDLNIAAVRHEGASETLGQTIDLPANDQDLQLAVTVGPVADEAAVLALTLSKRSTGEPLPKIRVRIRDENRVTLEGVLSDDAGQVTFRNLQAGQYLIELRYAGERFEIPITFGLSD